MECEIIIIRVKRFCFLYGNVRFLRFLNVKDILRHYLNVFHQCLSKLPISHTRKRFVFHFTVGLPPGVFPTPGFDGIIRSTFVGPCDPTFVCFCTFFESSCPHRCPGLKYQGTGEGCLLPGCPCGKCCLCYQYKQASTR